MTLTFPNRSRSFDQARKGVRFIAYDGMFEVPFFIDAAALEHESAAAEACLAAFDAGRAAIHDAAMRIYRGRKSAIYVIGQADLR